MYRTIDTACWTDPKVKELTPDGKLLFLYLITNDHSHMTGIYHLPLSYAAHETGLKRRELDTLCHTLSRVGLAHYDRVFEVVWVVKMFDRQARGQKNATAAAAHLATLHKCPLIEDFLHYYSHRQIPYAIPYAIGYTAVSVKEQEQEQEQDQKQEQEENQDAAEDSVKTESGSLPAPLPEVLDTPDFLSAWKVFLSQRAHRGKKVTPVAATRLLAKLAKYGPVIAVKAVDRALENDWQGVFPEKETDGTNDTRKKSGSGIAPAADAEINEPAAHAKYIA
jgi:hypothetical protein